MKRRDFMRVAGLGAVGVAVGAAGVKVASAQKPLLAKDVAAVAPVFLGNAYTSTDILTFPDFMEGALQQMARDMAKARKVLLRHDHLDALPNFTDWQTLPNQKIRQAAYVEDSFRHLTSKS